SPPDPFPLSLHDALPIYPRHRTVIPGSPSRRRPRKPPSLAINRTASLVVSREFAGGRAPEERTCKAATSSGARIVVAGAVGAVRLTCVNQYSRQATTLQSVTYRINIWAACK